MPERFKITSPLMKTPPNGKWVCRPYKWGNRITVAEAGHHTPLRFINHNLTLFGDVAFQQL